MHGTERVWLARLTAESVGVERERDFPSNAKNFEKSIGGPAPAKMPELNHRHDIIKVNVITQQDR